MALVLPPKIKNGPLITKTLRSFVYVTPYMIVGGISALTLGLQFNDIYCLNILKKQQYELKKILNSRYCTYYNAKYTKLFIRSISFIGLLGGGLYGYTKKPLISLIY